MELFEFCMEIIRREGERFNVGVNTSTASNLTASTAADVNYDIAHNRCAFLYRCGTINLHFAKDCFSKFFSDYKSIVFLLTKLMINCPHLTLCTISKGPALDYIALLLSYQDSGMFPSLFKNIKVISKHGAWRNTTNIMQEIISEGYLKCLPPSVSIGNIEVIQGDPFKDFTQKIKDPICDSDVVLMMKTLNLQTDGHNLENTSKLMQEFLGALKPGAILFCVDTKPSVAVITQLLATFSGKFLFHPTNINTMIKLEFADFYKNHFGCLPVMSGRGTFFVWEKSSILISSSKYLMEEVSESVKRLLKVNNSPDKDFSSEVAIDGCNINDDTSTANSFAEWQYEAANSVELKGSDQQSIDSIKSGDQNSKHYLSSSSLQNELPVSDDAKKKRKNPSIKSKHNSSLINKYTQTEPEKNLKETEQSRFKLLTNKIAYLTAEISELLETRALNEQMNNNCFKKSEDTCKHSIVSDCSHGVCPHKYPCSSFSPCAQSYSEMCCCQKGNLNSNKYNSNTFSGSEASKYCNSSCITESKLPCENKSPPVSQLIIPLNTLSADVASQIILLLAQSNQEL